MKPRIKREIIAALLKRGQGELANRAAVVIGGGIDQRGFEYAMKKASQELAAELRSILSMKIEKSKLSYDHDEDSFGAQWQARAEYVDKDTGIAHIVDFEGQIWLNTFEEPLSIGWEVGIDVTRGVGGNASGEEVFKGGSPQALTKLIADSVVRSIEATWDRDIFDDLPRD